MSNVLLRKLKRFIIKRQMDMMKAASEDFKWYLAGGIPDGSCTWAYRPKGAVSIAASYINLPNPGTYNANPVVVPGWDDVNGWIGNASAYLDTGYTPGQNDSVIVRFTGVGASQGCLFGCYQTVPANQGIFIYPSRSGSKQYVNGITVKTSAPGLTSGVMAVADRNGYYDANLDVSSLANWGAAPTYSIYILAFNLNGAPAQIITANIQAIAGYRNFDISPYIADLVAAMNAL